MEKTFETCANCGGAIELSPDGRAVQCPYCGRHEARAIDPNHLANALRVEARDAVQFLESLAGRLVTSFPEHTRVETGGGLFTAKHVEVLEVGLEQCVFRLERHGHKVEAKRAKSVRGITLKTEVLPLEAWLQGLCEELARMADASAAAQRALSALRGQG